MRINIIFFYPEFEFSAFGLGKNNVSVVIRRATKAISVHLVPNYIKISCAEEEVIKMARSSHLGLFLGKSCSENMQQTYRRTPMSKCNFNKID